MATLIADASRTRAASTWRPKGERTHRALLSITASAAGALVLFLAVHGYSYYSLRLEDRPFSPMHAQLRSSGTVGLKLGMLGVVMFGILFLYPLRKRWRWLSSIGSTRRWLNFHILFGIATPCVITFHTSFRFHGIAGLAYCTMLAVALSGFVGRYVYAKIPRSLNSVALTLSDLESQTAALAGRLEQQALFHPADMAPLLGVPSAAEVRAMGIGRTLWTMLRMDASRVFGLARLRRRALTLPRQFATLGGLLPSRNRDVEAIVANVRRQSRLLAATAFLHRTERIFYLWHVIHRPFSISFVMLIAIHIAVAISVGF